MTDPHTEQGSAVADPQDEEASQEASAQPARRKTKRFFPASFWWISLFVLLSDFLFVWFNYNSTQALFFENLRAQGQRQQAIFQLSQQNVSTHMQQVATFVANMPKVQQLFLAGRRAVEAEGGGAGGEQAAKLRAELMAEVAQGWKESMTLFGSRQLHFHLAPGDTSFLRVHAPHKFGDNLAMVRHTVVEANVRRIPTKGYESGRVYSGIRGVVPVFAMENGERVHVGALEAGTSFNQHLQQIKKAYGVELAVLMTMEHAKRTMWPDFLEKQKQLQPHSESFLVEFSTSTEIKSLMPEIERASSSDSHQCGTSRLIQLHGRPTAISCFDLYDFLGEQQPQRGPIAKVVAWYDATDSYGEFTQSVTRNIWFACIAFFLFELLLGIFWWLGTRGIQQLVHQRTVELEMSNLQLNRLTEHLEKSLTETDSANRQLSKMQAELEQRVEQRTASLAASEKQLATEVVIRTALNKLLEISLNAHTMDRLLEDAVNLLLTLKFLGVEAYGGAFVADHEERKLKLHTSVNLDPHIQQMCEIIPYGRCLCGRAAAEAEIIYSGHVDERHEVTYSDMPDHGHYSIPVLLDGMVVAVVVLYLRAGVPRDENAVDFLRSSADILSSAIRRLHTQDALMQSEKLASLGEMVAGVAHEINTPVGVGTTATSELVDKTRELQKIWRADGLSEEELKAYLESAEQLGQLAQQNMKRAAELVRSFKLVAVDQASEEKRHFNLKQHIEVVVTSMQHYLKRTPIKIEIDCAHDLRLNSYPGVFSQIFTNLIHNSLVHAFTPDEEGEVHIHVVCHKDHMEIVYRDTGRGIPLEHRKRIFEPFFTTRRSEGGSGLGMHIVHNLVTGHLDGTVVCEEPDTKGAQFHMVIPFFR
uniref:histidine kinase n=1 Tax=Magnetococcus massalia (strain MO-1) TaxID=451514 RepID=A0A1S7LGR8_MAGMO|nr:putative Histidine kinase [Candidatus Magnetococcus massalia]